MAGQVAQNCSENVHPVRLHTKFLSADMPQSYDNGTPKIPQWILILCFSLVVYFYATILDKNLRKA